MAAMRAAKEACVGFVARSVMGAFATLAVFRARRHPEGGALLAVSNLA